MPRLSDAQVRNAREQALRSVRRQERKLDTRIEVMERRLDRAIENKERITLPLVESIIMDFSRLVSQLKVLEMHISSAAVVFTSTFK